MNTDVHGNELQVGDSVVYAWLHKGQTKNYYLLFNGNVTKLLDDNRVMIFDTQSVRTVTCEGAGVLKVGIDKED